MLVQLFFKNVLLQSLIEISDIDNKKYKKNIKLDELKLGTVCRVASPVHYRRHVNCSTYRRRPKFVYQSLATRLNRQIEIQTDVKGDDFELLQKQGKIWIRFIVLHTFIACCSTAI
jgi:hypothetical protein